MRLKQHALILTIVTVILLLITACGPANTTEESNNAIGIDSPFAEAEQLSSEESTSPRLDEAGDDVETLPDTDSEGETAVSASSVQANPSTNGDIETDAHGVQVGFTEDGHPYRGNPDAPVVIEEFSDFQCPFCSRFFDETLPGIEEAHIADGTAVLIFYDFPLTNIHPQAMPAANASRCAGEQSATAYWAMHDYLFANPQAWSAGNPASIFAGVGADLGLEMESFTSCLESNKYFPQIEEDLNAGISRGIRSTPSFFINDQPLVGAQPLPTFMAAIAAVMNGGEIAAAPEAAPAEPQAAPTPAAIPLESGAGAMGDPNAPVTIIEYTDYQCPFCSRHVLQTMPRMMSELIETGQVYYILKDFPLDQLHPDARTASNAARCAGEQDAYWEMHDVIFAEQEEWSGLGAAANDYFVRLADSMGLDVASFEECAVNGRYADAIQANFEEGASLGVTGTPHFFIDGYPIVGARDFELFEFAVELAKEGTLADAYVQQPQQQEAPPPTPGVVEVPLGDAYAIGDPEAPVMIVEYTDFQCPYCSRHFAQTFPQIKENFIDTGVVYYVFKDFPLNFHPQAEAAAEAARCAGAQEAYLPMHNIIFDRQTEWNNRDDAVDLFIGYATELGLDSSSFGQCMNNHTYLDAVRADAAEGSELGVNGTPAFFLNGYFVSGAQPYDLFEEAIAQLVTEGN